ncbi:MAG: serine acetyltransferase [Bacteroidales bacterium]|nr:serine acetyltransferase [Bacteroidales bacterium]
MTVSIKQSTGRLEEMMAALKDYVFPEYADLREEIARKRIHGCLCEVASREIADSFAEQLPELRRMIGLDVQAIADTDPAASGIQEIIYCYPAVTAMLHYRSAHTLHELGLPVIPRMLTEMAHSATGIDIHPAAVIGESFAIDHGTGIVIGETAIIGKGVTLYQGVTLGARSFRYDSEGRPVNAPRHPILGDGVTVYSNASILGRVHIGDGAVIGGNVWLTRSVPPGARVLQGRALENFSDGAGI